jgi:hypothetical protein
VRRHFFVELYDNQSAIKRIAPVTIIAWNVVARIHKTCIGFEVEGVLVLAFPIYVILARQLAETNRGNSKEIGNKRLFLQSKTAPIMGLF